MVEIIFHAPHLGAVDFVTGEMQGTHQTDYVSVETTPEHCCDIVISGPDRAVNNAYLQIEQIVNKRYPVGS